MREKRGTSRGRSAKHIEGGWRLHGPKRALEHRQKEVARRQGRSEQKREGNIVREYKAMHEKICLGSWLREVQDGKVKEEEEKIQGRKIKRSRRVAEEDMEKRREGGGSSGLQKCVS